MIFTDLLAADDPPENHHNQNMSCVLFVYYSNQTCVVGQSGRARLIGSPSSMETYKKFIQFVKCRGNEYVRQKQQSEIANNDKGLVFWTFLNVISSKI